MISESLSEQSIKTLKEKASEDTEFIKLLETSLNKANVLAHTELSTDLYSALEWPTNIEEYQSYLIWFSKWIPKQSNDPAWLAPGTNEHQEVYDRLCHFYWLINQPVGEDDSTIVQNIPWFSDWLINYANAWGSFLNTTDSFNQDALDSFIKYSPKYQVENSLINGKPNNPSGWLTFNQFFARELNPGLRPISTPFDNRVVTSPADCTFKDQYDIAADSSIPEITVKKTHNFANIEDLLQGSQYKSAFANGTFVHYFLGPYSYHRFHVPVAGVIKECYPVQGLVYLDVNLKNGQFDAPDSSEGGYEFSQARGIITVDTTGSVYGDIGIVAIIPVGMCQVSSVNMTATVGREALKGDEFGYFLFGGSDIIVLFQEGVNPQVNTSTDYRHYGSVIANVSTIR